MRLSEWHYQPRHVNPRIQSKPALGMYEKAIRDLEIDIEKSRAVGDKMRDCAICKKTACRGFLIGTNEKRDIIAKVKQGAFCNIRYAAGLYESAQMIVSEGKQGRIIGFKKN